MTERAVRIQYCTRGPEGSKSETCELALVPRSVLDPEKEGFKNWDQRVKVAEERARASEKQANQLHEERVRSEFERAMLSPSASESGFASAPSRENLEVWHANFGHQVPEIGTTHGSGKSKANSSGKSSISKSGSRKASFDFFEARPLKVQQSNLPEGQRVVFEIADSKEKWARKCRGISVGSHGTIGSHHGYYHGMISSYVRSICRKNDDPMKVAMTRDAVDSDNDAVQIHRPDIYKRVCRVPEHSKSKECEITDFKSPVVQREMIKASYSILLPLGLKESNGDPSAGKDSNNGSRHAKTHEAGLFQLSPNVLDFRVDNKMTIGGVVGGLFNLVSNLDPVGCMRDLFFQDVKGEKKSSVMALKTSTRVVKNHSHSIEIDPESVRKLFRACPAVATETAAISVHHALAHNGPLHPGRGFKPAKECDDVFDVIAEYVEKRPDEACPAFAVKGNKDTDEDEAKRKQKLSDRETQQSLLWLPSVRESGPSSREGAVE